MPAPTTFDLFVIYDPQDASSSATTLRFPSAKDRDMRLESMDRVQTAGGASFQLVPNLRFRRMGATLPLSRPSVKVKEALDRMAAPPSSDVFMDPRTGHWVTPGWRPGQPISDLNAFVTPPSPPRPKRAAKRVAR